MLFTLIYKINTMQKTGIIYLVTNIINDKKYVGQTYTLFESRKRRHYRNAFEYNQPFTFYNALRKYNKENFKWEIIEKDIEISSLDEREIYWINFYDSHNNGYNMTDGGRTIRGYHHTEESKRKNGEKHKGKSNLNHYITRYGEIEGRKVYDDYINKMKDRKGKKRIDLLIEKYGEIEGRKKYELMVESIKLMRKNKGATNTLDYFIKQYGEIEGKCKYEIFSNKLKNRKDTEEARKLKSDRKKQYWKNKKGGN